MPKTIIYEYMYIFVVDGKIVKQWSYLSDKDALDEAKDMENKIKKKVLVARWLEDIE